MISTGLNFNPHLVWAGVDGFYVFGYSNGYYHYRTPDGKKSRWIATRTRHPHHFNHAHSHQMASGGFDLIRRGCYATIDASGFLIFNNADHTEFKRAFSWSAAGRQPVLEGSNQLGLVPLTANYHEDNYGNVLYAWGRRLAFVGEKSKIYKLDKTCTDAKFSPCGRQIAVAVDDGIKFADTSTIVDSPPGKNLLFPQTMELSITGQRPHHLSYSLDGLVLASVTKCRKLVIWDVD
jgi:hypothetical protein